MINGVLNVWKEAGFTSHDVVAKLRGILHQKKIGHTGTLDPDATGVLPVCLGKGTRLCDMLTDETKTYEALLHLGIATDTQDMSGTVTAEAPVTVTEEEVRDCIASFAGEQQQVPPMYSALKVNGKKLYELAREGIEIERKARTVHFLRDQHSGSEASAGAHGGNVFEGNVYPHPVPRYRRKTGLPRMYGAADPHESRPV